MTQTTFQRTAAATLALAGLLIAIFWITHPETLNNPDGYQRQHLLGLIGVLLLPVGLVGIGMRLMPTGGGLPGLIGFLLAFLSSLFAIGVSAADAFIWPAIARVQPGLILAPNGTFDESSAIFTSNFVLIGAGLLMVVIGYALLAIALWQKRTFGRPAILLLVYAAWATAIAPGFVPHDALAVKALVYIPVAIGWIWVGVEMWQTPLGSERK